MSKRRRKRGLAQLPKELVEVEITALSSEGRGIAHVDNRTVFIDRALVGERVKFNYTRLTKNIAEGKAVEIIQASSLRVKPKCDVFELCGGCSLQHMSSQTQIKLKQAMLLDQLKHHKVIPEKIIEPLVKAQYGYRHKARLGVRYVDKKEKVLVGFRERNASFITDMQRCEVLHPSVGDIIGELANCINQLEEKCNIAQIEVAVGEEQTALVFRNLVTLSASDKKILSDFCQQKNIVAYLQAGKPDDLELLYPAQTAPLFYILATHNLKIEFQPADFTQVNPAINQQMIINALAFLQLNENDNVLDLFSGLGNFSLAMAKCCAKVTAVEGGLSMVEKARNNARLNKIENVEFIYADLYGDEINSAAWLKKKYQKVLLDPPRSGAVNILPALKKMQASIIVYVSCHPATLARDAEILVQQLGYKLTRAGIMDMFPHTAHIESIAVFEK